MPFFNAAQSLELNSKIGVKRKRNALAKWIAPRQSAVRHLNQGSDRHSESIKWLLCVCL